MLAFGGSVHSSLHQSVFENSFLQSARPTLREIRPKISQRSPLRLLISEQISHKL